ncbi:phosphonate C-P lyase system protein PhnH [Bradyrhizobium sp. WSM 1738]|uniref:phosphonate C-P lyase system protein PhnH n=1 Tax=Bradyrhizobium hereditatis TaxID=2821405 RepID=UPI001CE2A744|nr:phosphonate C-P lyase system protein PhnH [Bradyrhizobium hereditatis]MCA6119345.1 phosphonate C-P lyase system protein PhnH [Bradyrhizobium hereditatis]
MTTVAELPAGFADKVLSAQSTFRSVMDAMARPGGVQRIRAQAGTPAPMMHGTAAIALTLFDHDTPIWLDGAMSATPDAAKWLKFHTSAPVIAEPSVCSFAVIGDARSLPPLDRFALGSNEYPDRSTTLILQVDSLTSGPAYELTGPGIDGASVLQAMIPANLLELLAINATLFPRGIDVVLVHDDAIVAIPRTTRLAAYGA